MPLEAFYGRLCAHRGHGGLGRHHIGPTDICINGGVSTEFHEDRSGILFSFRTGVHQVDDGDVGYAAVVLEADFAGA